MMGAQALVKTLEAEGVEYVFGIPGTHVLSAYDELSKSRIKTIQTTHEQGAGFMADCYGRVSRKPGIALVTTGPGAINIANAVAQAHVESSPMLVISGQCNKRGWGKGLYHELIHPDVQINFFKDITKKAIRVEDATQIPEAISNAISTAAEGRNRPTYVEIPENIFDDEMNITTPIKPTSNNPRKKAMPEELAKFVKEVNEAKHPMILAGGGVLASGAKEELLKFSTKFRIPIATTIMGKSSCPDSHQLGLGIGSGILATPAAKTALAQTDLVIAIGTRFDEVASGFFTLEIPRLVHVDVDAKEFGRNYPAATTIHADAKEFLGQALGTKSLKPKATLPSEESRTIRQKMQYSNSGSGLDPQYVLDASYGKLKHKPAIIVGDAGNSSMWLLGCDNFDKHTTITPSGYNSMGFAVPGAIGAKLASPNSEVIAVCGDGAFLMTGNELITAAKYGIKITCIVLNDERYNILTFFQNLKFAGRHTDTHIRTLDLQKFAESIGVLSQTVTTESEVDKALEKALAHNGPGIIDVRINPELIPPILSRLQKP